MRPSKLFSLTANPCGGFLVYISVPLRPVPVPTPANRRRYRLWQLSVWLGYSVAISVLVFLAVRFMTHGLGDGVTRRLFAVVDVLGALLSWLFTLMHSREASAKRWRKAAYPVYRESVAEVKGWSWDVRGAAVFDGKWRIVCLRRGAHGSDAHSFSAPQGRVTLLPGEEDSLAFGSATLSAADYPGYNDRILIGGDVTITFRSSRGGPPPLETRYQPDDSPE